MTKMLLVSCFLILGSTQVTAQACAQGTEKCDAEWKEWSEESDTVVLLQHKVAMQGKQTLTSTSEVDGTRL